MTEEDLFLHNYINNIKYPRYFDVARIIGYDVVSRYYYNKYYHDLLSNLWRNMDNEDVMVDIGLKIFNRGGIISLKICLYIYLSVMYHMLVNDRIDGYVIFNNLKQKIRKSWDIEFN